MNDQAGCLLASILAILFVGLSVVPPSVVFAADRAASTPVPGLEGVRVWGLGYSTIKLGTIRCIVAESAATWREQTPERAGEVDDKARRVEVRFEPTPIRRQPGPDLAGLLLGTTAYVWVGDPRGEAWVLAHELQHLFGPTADRQHTDSRRWSKASPTGQYAIVERCK